MSDNHRDLWSEVKRIDQCNTMSKIVDGTQCDSEISNIFAEK